MVTPEDFGFAPRPIEEIRGGDAETNRAIAESILAGHLGARRDVVLINAALALMAAGKASSFREGAALAAESINSGNAHRKLDALRAIL
jgi:anthranilate phosphoribosyltransferase